MPEKSASDEPGVASAELPAPFGPEDGHAQLAERASTSTDTLMNQAQVEDEIDRQEKALERLLGWIGAVDTKVPIVAGFDTALLGVLAAFAPDRQAFVTADGAWVALGSVCLAVSLVDCALASFPRTAGPASSCIFFGAIAAHPYQTYLKFISERTKEQYFHDLTMQCHRNAEIANQKYRHLRRAVGWMFGGIVPWLVALYLLL